MMCFQTNNKYHSMIVILSTLLFSLQIIFSTASRAVDSSSSSSSNIHDKAASNNDVVTVNYDDTATTSTSSAQQSSQSQQYSPQQSPQQQQQIITTTQEEENEARSICQSLAGEYAPGHYYPLLSSNCYKYISCQENDIIEYHNCLDGKVFDIILQGCNWKDRVHCPEYYAEIEGDVRVSTGEESEIIDNIMKETGESVLPVDTQHDFIIPHTTTNNNNNMNKETELLQICISKSFGLYALYSTQCTEYVTCFNGQVSSIQKCHDTLLFDNTIQNCNWPNQVMDRGCHSVVVAKIGVEKEGEEEEEEEAQVVVSTIDASSSTTESSTTTTSSTVKNVRPTTVSRTRRPTTSPTSTVTSTQEEESEAKTICQSLAGEYAPGHYYPLLSSKCYKYISCQGDDIIEYHTCLHGKVFDITEQSCKLGDTVHCPEYYHHTTDIRDGADATVDQQQQQQGMETQQQDIIEERNSASSTKVYEWLNTKKQELNDNVFQSTTKDGVSYRSYWFQLNDFIKALQVSNASSNYGRSITGNPKHIFYLGNKEDEWEYGLVNAAAFLAHAMTLSIKHDACDEFNSDKNTDADAAAVGGVTKFAISNSCGQLGYNYEDFHCPDNERQMECPVNKNLNIQATTTPIYPNAPPPLSCRPRNVSESYTGYWDVSTGEEVSTFPYENAFGRTNIEGCCYWGRGAIHTRGVCNIGKLNYYLGKKAADDGRMSRYPTTDFCAFPEAICAAPESKEMRWVTSMFEWTERVQSFDDLKGWNYLDELRKFVDGGLFDFDFFDATSGLIDQGCIDPPCAGSSAGQMGSKAVHLKDERRNNFQTILQALSTGSEKALLRGMVKYFSDMSDVMNGQILRSQTPQGQLYPSYRYTLDDMLASMTYMAETGVGGRKFYIGESKMGDGVKYGVVNAAVFLAQAYKEAIQFDACDENNWQLVNERFPLSNSCGQLGMSYQDMHCREDEAFMECPVKKDMEMYALTSALWFQAPGPFKCGPKSKFPTTGFWDYDLGRENNEDAFANSRGRVDVEGCCWWGRGVLQTRGVCNFGKLNYYLGARASREGRPALYPDIDFCEFPQGICSSDQTYGGQMQWMVGLFEWADRVQTYSKDGWNYIDELHKFVDGGYKDFSFVDAVSGVVNIGCHDPPCKGFGNQVVQPHNKRERNEVFQRFLNQLQVARNFRPDAVPTPLPTPGPTTVATDAAPGTLSPTEMIDPTMSPTTSPRPTAIQGRPPEISVKAVEGEIIKKKGRFTELILQSKHPSGALLPSYLYTWRGFIKALRKMTSGVGPGEKNFFYVGDGESPNSLNYGLVNIAAFLADAVVKSIYDDACDENSHEMVNNRYPISNSCGQGGLSYQDEICKGGDAGMECSVDTKMVSHGVTHARWLGAPPPMYCGDRSTGYWDHVAGLERNDPPFSNLAGRNDVRGCCWWGRGVSQIRGVCSYGKLNHFLGAKAAADGRPSIYPDIDFCKNPGAICSDRRSEELRWVTGMFHWVATMQKHNFRGLGYTYLEGLQNFVDDGNFTATEFIDGINDVLGGSYNDTVKRKEKFYDALRVFGMIEDYTSDATAFNFCGITVADAGMKCTVRCVNDFDCPGNELCQPGVTACIGVGNVESDSGSSSSSSGGSFGADVVAEINMGDNEQQGDIGDILPQSASLTNESEEESDDMRLSSFVLPTTYYCGESWGHASSSCLVACPGGNDAECPPNQKCFADVTACSREEDDKGESLEDTTNYCGKTWDDAFFMCFAKTQCPGGQDAECPTGEKCFGGIQC